MTNTAHKYPSANTTVSFFAPCRTPAISDDKIFHSIFDTITNSQDRMIYIVPIRWAIWIIINTE
ncbi:unnamed protein product, partial [Brugia timori]|uniref:Uncharacterized protein n=1 Tax=Brugia timori TaxID=42155 RepID=A0A0R3RAK4_9BILA